MGYLAVADVGSVEPYVEAGIYALEVEESCRCAFVSLVIEILYVGSAGIVLGYIRRIKGKWVAYVGVLVGIITCHLPGARYFDAVKR